MKVKYDTREKLLRMEITEEIDHHTTEKIKGRADFEIQRYIPKKVQLDFKNVNFMDSSGIGMIIGRYKLVSMLGGSLEIINASDKIRKILEMSGILKIIPIVAETKVS